MRNNNKTIIPINEDYRLTADKRKWSIQHPRTRKGQKDWESKSHYPNCESALKGLRELMVRTSGAESVADLLEAIERASTTLSQPLTPQIEGVLDPQDESTE